MVTRLRDNVWWINRTGVNAYLVSDDDALTLVDAGFPWDGRSIAHAISTVGDSIGDLDRILLTHYDIDHIGSLGSIGPIDATIYIGRADASYLTRGAKPPLRSHKGAIQRISDWLRTVPEQPVERVDDGDTIGSFTAHATPGHTPGHTAYVSESLSTAFLGDMVRESRGQFALSPWIISYDTAENEKSVRSFVDSSPAFEVACPGHGVPFVENGSSRLQNCVDKI